MKKAILVAAAAAALTAGASAQITINVWDDGTDLFMGATGNYDMSNQAVNTRFSGLGLNATMWPATNLHGWETNLGNGSIGYDMVQNGTLTGANGPSGANFVSNSNPFFIFGNTIHFDVNAPVVGSVNELARFDGVTLASLGMILGESASFSWGNGGAAEGGTLNAVLIPAPASVALLGLGGLVATRRRR